jgi:hypothetical protein
MLSPTAILLDALRDLLSPVGRRSIYGIAIAVMSLLTFYGVLPAAAIPVWSPLLLAILNVPGKAREVPEIHDVDTEA